MHNRLAIRDIQLITPIRKNMKHKMIAFPNFSKRRKVIERVFSFWIVLELSGLKVEQLRYKIKKRTSAILLMVSIALFFSKIPKNVKTSFLSSTWRRYEPNPHH